MAVNTHIINSTNTAVTFRDGTGTPVTLTLTNDVKITVSGHQGRSNQTMTPVQRRGKHYGVAYGERIYPQITLEFLHDGWESDGSAPGTPVEFARFTTPYNSNVSTTAGGTRSPKTIDIVVALEGSDFGGADKQVVFEDCLLMAFDVLTEADGGASGYTMTFSQLGDTTGDLAFSDV